MFGQPPSLSFKKKCPLSKTKTNNSLSKLNTLDISLVFIVIDEGINLEEEMNISAQINVAHNMGI